MMVLSTALDTDLNQGESPYHDFEWQVIGIVVGLPIMWAMARSSPRVFRAWPTRCSRCRSSGSA